MNRAYSTIELRAAAGEDERVIEGVASTPTPDRMDDVLEPMGAKFKTPLPALLFHDSKNPVATVESLKANKDGILFRMRFPKAGLLPKVDEAYTMVKAGLIRAVSVGFRPIGEPDFIKETGGLHFLKWELLELSLVSVPANAEATITNIKSLDEPYIPVKSADTALLAALGTRQSSVVRLGKTATFPGASGPTRKKNMTIKEQIASFEAKRAASEARMAELMEKASAETRSFEADETEEYDGLDAEVKSIDGHLVRLKAHEQRLIANAKQVTPENTSNAQRASETRGGIPASGSISVKSNLPKGIGVARMAIAMIRSKGNPYQAMEIAKQAWGVDQPEIAQHIKSVVEAGDTTTSGWASQLLPSAQQMSGDFLDMLRPMLIMGKIPLKEVPFNVAVPLQSGGGTYGYVGEGAPKPVTKPTYGSASLRFEKAAGIIVITQELARFSNPKAEMLVRDEMLKGLANYFDTVFVGSGAAVTNVMPAGILNGKSTTGAASGTTAARFRYDMNIMIQVFITNNQDISTAYLLMSSGIAMALSSMINSLGQPDFPTINANGGSYLGIPIVVSQNLGTNIILIQPNNILLAEDPAITIDVSTEASVEMDTAPAGGETSPVSDISTLKSLWQNNLVGIRCEQFRTWKVARTSAVEFISGAAYTPPTS